MWLDEQASRAPRKRELDAVLKRRQRQAERARLRRHEEPGLGSCRSAHVWVDPEAWAVIKRTGLERWKSAGETTDAEAGGVEARGRATRCLHIV